MRGPRMRYGLTLALLATMTSASACSSGPVTSYCAVAVPLYVSRDDVLTDETARQIVTHNETWKALCHAR